MNLLLRVVSGALLLLILAAALWFGMPWVAVAVGVAVVISTWELDGLLRKAGAPPTRWLLYPLAVWLAVRPALPPAWQPLEWPLAAAVTIGLLGAVLRERTFTGWLAAVGGALYLGFALAFFIAMYQLAPATLDHGGLRLVAVPLLAVVAGDTAAYFTGSAIGRHPFFRAISPKKTLEGALGGAVASVAVAAISGAALAGMPWLQAAALGLVVAVAAQGGDLAESALKRRAGVKDSSRLIPGHGGILDRVDSLVVVAPAAYCFLRLIAL